MTRKKTHLRFGTAGIRAPLGMGPDDINATTVRTVAAALGEYLAVCFTDAREKGVCIGFDGRTQSDEFALAAIEILLAQGFVVHRFVQVVPTPLVAFCTRHLDAVAGVMITASHNPATDNGIKVYFRGGAQVLPPHDGEIAARMHAMDDADLRPRMMLSEGHTRGQLRELGEAETGAYLSAIEGLLAARGDVLDLSIAYTAMCGVGSATTHAMLARRSVREVHEVGAQAQPRADFGGLSSPNPEHRPALAQVIELAERAGCELAFAHDPDADRLALMARDRDGVLRVLSGDETGSLLAEALLSRANEVNGALVVSTTVSSELIARIAQSHGAHFEQTLTGFKWIASRARKLEREESLHFVFGYEEAIGFAFGALGDDKDGIAAMAVLLELAAALKARGSSLCGELERLSQLHGMFVSRQITFSAEGEGGMSRLREAMRRVRAMGGAKLLGVPCALRDYAHEPEAADLLVLRAGDTRICVRPSGTEPKLKVYLHARVEAEACEVFEAWQARTQALLNRLEVEGRALVAW